MEDLEQQQLLASIVLDNKILDDCGDIKPEYFDVDILQRLFSYFMELRVKGMEIVPSILYKRFGKDKKQEIVNILSNFPLPKNQIPKTIKSIAENGKRRIDIERMKEIIEEYESDPSYDIYNSLSTIEPLVSDDVKDFGNSALQMLEWKLQNPNQISGIKSGINELDEIINGFNSGRIYICAGRSSMGKSAFMTSITSNIEKENKVGIISLEMTGEELYNRIVCCRLGIPYWVIDKGKATNEQFDLISGEVEKIKNLMIYDKGGLNCFQICSRIRKMVKDGCKLVFIDHLGLIQVDERGNLAHNIGKITSALKSLAKELNIPIIILCQVNRAVEGAMDKKPSLKDLRDSGRIEEDADCVFFLYREEYYNPIITPDGRYNRYENALILIEKNRNGPCRTIKCVFDNNVMKFYGKVS